MPHGVSAWNVEPRTPIPPGTLLHVLCEDVGLRA